MRKYLIFSIMVILLTTSLLSACQAATTSPATDTATTEPAITATDTPQETSVPTGLSTTSPSSTPLNSLSNNKITQYHFNAALSFEEDQLAVGQAIDYTNTTGNILKEIPLVIPPKQVDGVFDLIFLFTSQTVETPQTHFDGAALWVTFPEPLEPSESIELVLTYNLWIPEGRSLLGKTDRQLILTDWYPFIPPYLQTSGWLINEPSNIGEYLVYPLADYWVNLSVLGPMNIASSVPPTIEDNSSFSVHKAENVRNVTFAFSPEYLEYTRDTEDVTIKAYVFPEHAELGQRAADLAADAWALYENLYGDNPREYMAIIEADLNDGMEYDGAFLLSQDYFAAADDTPQNYFELLIVHETAHQWFYAQIANDQANEPWLDEALATYSELLYLEKTYPELVDWWWNYRIYAYQPMGWVDSTIYDHAGFRPYVNAVYLRGVQFLNDLRQRIGDDAFFAILRDYATPDAMDTFRSSVDFFSLVAAYSSEDVSSLLERYFRNTQP